MKNTFKDPSITPSRLVGAAWSVAGIAVLMGAVRAHGVVPLATKTRVYKSTTALPARVGDVLTFVLEVEPLPNNATLGAGAYATVYVPANAEVVGARIIDERGNTVGPRPGPLMPDGVGPRGRHDEFDALGLLQGSLSQAYADTGIFYSVDPRTTRNPDNTALSVFNGILISPAPTGAGQLEALLGVAGGAYFSHNHWDRTQALAFGANAGILGDGRGNTPFGFGSPVAGPATHYSFEKVSIPACSDGSDNDSDGARRR